MKRTLPIVVAMLLCVFVALRIAQAADMVLTVTFSDAGGKANGLITDYAVATGWTVNVSNGMGGTIPNPLTRPQYATERLKLHMRETVKAFRANVEVEKTRTKILADTDAEIIFK